MSAITDTLNCLGSFLCCIKCCCEDDTPPPPPEKSITDYLPSFETVVSVASLAAGAFGLAQPPSAPQSTSSASSSSGKVTANMPWWSHLPHQGRVHMPGEHKDWDEQLQDKIMDKLRDNYQKSLREEEHRRNVESLENRMRNPTFFPPRPGSTTFESICTIN